MLTRICAASLLSFTLAMPAVAQVEDDAIEKANEAFSMGQEEIYENSGGDRDKMMEGFKELAAEVLADIDLNELTVRQIADLSNTQLGSIAAPSTLADMLKRLEAIATDAETDALDVALAAAVGSTMQVASWYYEEEAPAWAEKTKAELHTMYLDHPKAAKVMQTEYAAAGINAMLTPIKGEETVPSSRFKELLNAIGNDPAGEAVSAADVMWTMAKEMHERDEDAISDETRERARLLTMKWFKNGAQYYADQGEQRGADYYNGAAEALNSRAARGLLIGYEAPELSIQWCSDENVTSLADLKGKVVVLDFWATWCGPCIASFPEVRELRAMYPEEHVAIVGITSPQGQVFNINPGEPSAPIDCEGSVEKEIELTSQFMDNHKISWTIAMLGGTDEVFHPEFGVQGIPHVAILDADGKVRYNGLHPSDPDKTEKINKLLKEADLPVPGE